MMSIFMTQVGGLIQYHFAKDYIFSFFLGGWHCMQAKALVGMKGDAGPQNIGDVHNSRAFDETID